ncbi:hypothetical protein F5148DRAFT_503183 [Russula earlei]|uniref:Uncharacterized protein n=1 Tax=Russula earlei TaxID=71964 RepID=A0ACC0TYM0_9AGAM|nr:hypothetical protein F5148DRAFT_503183 [Russula earlei]
MGTVLPSPMTLRLILTCTISEDRIRKGAEKLAQSLNAKQQGWLDGFFTSTPKASVPTKGKERKTRVRIGDVEVKSGKKSKSK